MIELPLATAAMAEAAGTRPAVADDLDTVLAPMASYCGEDDFPYDATAAREAVAGLIEAERPGRLRVVERSGPLLGYLALSFGYGTEYRGRGAFIDELNLAPGARGDGGAGRLLAIAAAACGSADVKALHLEVEPDKQRARPLRKGRFRGSLETADEQAFPGPRAGAQAMTGGNQPQ